MNDLISREAALERAEACTFTDKNEKRKFMDWLNYCLDAAIEPQWIPCSERLPEEDGEYLAWIRYDGHEFMSIEDFECSGLLAQWNFEGRNDDEVIAWMPLPQPYKGE